MRFAAPSLVLFAFSCLAVAAPVPKAIKAPDYYPCAVGTKWVYAEEDGSNPHTREITASSTKNGVTTFVVTWKEGDQTQLWEMKKDATGVYRTKQDSFEFSPPHLLFEHAIGTGDEWVGEYTFGGTTTYKYSRTVGKPEVVKTPAGKFTAFPIASKNLRVDSGETTLWYADGVGLVKLQQPGQPAVVLREFTEEKK